MHASPPSITLNILQTLFIVEVLVCSPRDLHQLLQIEAQTSLLKDQVHCRGMHVAAPNLHGPYIDAQSGKNG